MRRVPPPKLRRSPGEGARRAVAVEGRIARHKSITVDQPPLQHVSRA